jgi:hypothetical protein
MDMRSIGKRIVCLAVLLFLLSMSIPAAHAEFLRVGPTGFGGYPAWYQDKTGLAMEFCSPLNASELAGGWCLLLTGDTTAPEVFPTSFFDEHFYWAAGAAAPLPGAKALLTLALEGAFAVGPVIQGDQIVFGRLRIVVNPLPASGDYTVYTPFGKYVFPGQIAGDKLFFTEDIGIQCPPGDFSCALLSKVGPYLLPSAVPGGPEMAPVTAANPTPDTDPAHFGGVFAATAHPGTGKSYIADPARIGPVTGSTLPPYVVADGTTRNPNIFRIEGPGGLAVETVDFNLMGRLYEGTMTGQMTVDRASYDRTATANKVDVYATALPALPARIPASPAPPLVPTTLAYFDAACTPTLDAAGLPGPPYSAPVGAVATQMVATGSHYFGQSHPATLPLDVCVRVNAVNAAGQTVTTFIPAPLGDQITISEALFDLASQSLSIRATSSDQVVAQTLTVEGLGTINPATGQLLVNPILAPPEKVTVVSSGRGLTQLQMKTGAVAGGGTLVPVAVNDAVTTLEDTATTISVLANDTGAVGGTVTLASAPLLGTAVVAAGGSIAYTPRLNAFGTDTFTYRVTVGTQVSNTASVTVTITPVNDPPVANPDNLTAIANLAATLNVLANDTDPDGAADIVAVASLSAVTPAAGTTGTATVASAGNTVSFAATAAGIYSFTYRARDAAGALSNPTTVTVTVASAETITITLAQFVVSGGRYRVSGSIAPAAGQTMTIQMLNTAGSVLRTDTVASAAGAWALDIRNISLPTGANRVRVTSSNGSVATATLTLK